jgi:catechol 2,3-dioxygenase-like lactoylglutathione lyase family enzyme
MKLHHVQVACARDSEDDARRFYAEGLGTTEVEKPARCRGSCAAVTSRSRNQAGSADLRPSPARQPRRPRRAVADPSAGWV